MLKYVNDVYKQYLINLVSCVTIHNSIVWRVGVPTLHGSSHLGRASIILFGDVCNILLEEDVGEK